MLYAQRMRIYVSFSERQLVPYAVLRRTDLRNKDALCVTWGLQFEKNFTIQTADVPQAKIL